MLIAADAAPAAGPPWLAVVLAVVSLIGVVGVALAPALVEKIKRGKPKEETKASAVSAESAALPTPAVVQRTDQALDLVGAAMVDAQHERDEAQAKAERFAKAKAKVDLENAQLRALIYRLDPTWNGDSSGRSAG